MKEQKYINLCRVIRERLREIDSVLDIPTQVGIRARDPEIAASILEKLDNLLDEVEALCPQEE